MPEPLCGDCLSERRAQGAGTEQEGELLGTAGQLLGTALTLPHDPEPVV